MQEKSPFTKIKEILEGRRLQEIYPDFTIEYFGRMGKDKPKFTRGSKREFTGDKKIYFVELKTNGDIDEETIRVLKKQLNKRRLRLHYWVLRKRPINEHTFLKLEYYSVY